IGTAAAPIDDRDVVESQESALEDVVSFTVDLVDPPGKIDQELVKAAFEEIPVSAAGPDSVHVVNAPDGPCLNRGIQVGELPFIAGDLTVGVLELLEQ